MKRRTNRIRPSALTPGIVLQAGLAIALLIGGTAQAASIPAWLDDAISEWNAENPELQIEFVDIKDSYVWYRVPTSADIGHQEIRSSIYEIILGHGYKLGDDEELVTTAKPPSPTAPYKAKKCWTRSFVLDIDALSNTTSAGAGQRERAGTRQRMLTSMVCQDPAYWFTGFRVLQ